jgi:hypothetical protein
MTSNTEAPLRGCYIIDIHEGLRRPRSRVSVDVFLKRADLFHLAPSACHRRRLLTSQIAALRERPGIRQSTIRGIRSGSPDVVGIIPEFREALSGSANFC